MLSGWKTWAAAAACAALSLGCKGTSGTNGANGQTSLIVTTVEAAGAHCASGGTRIDSGPDTDADGVLDASEIVTTQYVCNPDTRDPVILSVDPKQGVIANTATFTVAFSEAMDPASISAETLFLSTWGPFVAAIAPGESEPVAAELAYEAATHTATLTPSAPLALETSYELHVTAGVRDLEGNSVPETVLSYYVDLDRIPPQVSRVTPVDGGVVVPTSPVAVVFDEPLNAASGAAAALELVDGTGAPVAGTSSFDGAAAVSFAPAAPLAVGAYTASLDAIAADVSGNWAHLTRSWTFTVEAPALPVLRGPPSASPASQAAGGLVELTARVNASARAMNIYVGLDYTVQPLFMLGTITGNENGEGAITGTLPIPWNVPPGSYPIWVVVYEPNTYTGSFYVAQLSVSTSLYAMWTSTDDTPVASNIPFGLVTVSEGHPVTPPDLAMTAALAPGAAGAGDITYAVTNLGTTAAGPFVAGLWVNPAHAPQLYSVPDYWLDVAGLAGGASSTGTIAVSGLPTTVTRIYGMADLTASVAEPNEANNVTVGGYRWLTAIAFPNATPVAIPDLTTITSNTTVAGGPTSIADVTVTLDITHTYVGDLRITLTSPSGTSVVLLQRRGGSGGGFTNTVLDDFATASIGASSGAPFTGTFRPEQPLATFAGENANGVWTLTVADQMGGDFGTLNGWTLTLW